MYYLSSPHVAVAGLNCPICAACNNYASKQITQMQFLVKFYLVKVLFKVNAPVHYMDNLYIKSCWCWLPRMRCCLIVFTRLSSQSYQGPTCSFFFAVEAHVQAAALTDTLRNEPGTLGETNLENLCAAAAWDEELWHRSCELRNASVNQHRRDLYHIPQGACTPVQPSLVTSSRWNLAGGGWTMNWCV